MQMLFVASNRFFYYRVCQNLIRLRISEGRCCMQVEGAALPDSSLDH
jgi:hypothetical protein